MANSLISRGGIAPPQGLIRPLLSMSATLRAGTACVGQGPSEETYEFRDNRTEVIANEVGRTIDILLGLQTSTGSLGIGLSLL